MRAVELAGKPRCQVCDGERPAAYDGPTRFGRHGYMCVGCHATFGVKDSSITVRVYGPPATHHGPWCDDPDHWPEEACPKCRPAKAVDQGLWLLARLAAHWEYNRRLPKNAQAPLDGFELNGADWLEVAQLSLALGKVRRRG